MLNRALALFVLPFFSFALDTSSLNVDEAAMFGSSNQSLVSAESLTKAGLGSNAFPQVKFGGRLFTSADWGVRRGLGNSNYAWSNNLLQTYLQGDLSLDVRVNDGFRMFGSASVSYAPAVSVPIVSTNFLINASSLVVTTNVQTNFQNSTNIAAIVFKEFFADLNIARIVYLRLGKQNLAWGRGYFWTPTDLINIQKVDFVNRDISREGTYGLRLHIPYKTYFNFYGFANAGSTLDFNKYSLALKTEFLIGPVEFALSGLFRPNRRSVFGADFSFGIAGWNFYGEGLLAQDGQTDKLRTNSVTNIIVYAVPESYRETNAFLRANIGVSKSFDQDRFTFGVEGFYNGEGYDNNPLGDPTLKPAFSLGLGYKPLEFGKWYAAAYISRSELFAKTTTIGVSTVWNILDGSLLVSPSITVVPFDYFTASFRLPMYFGPENREFTFQDRQLNAQLELSYRF
ncbi:MAG: hypothetical protein JNM63_11910 [Spirochaetia bacterium]|nr:hypothetical protein [Spirochaetia bacterium]